LSRVPASPSFALASPADDADLRRLLQANPMRGAISVGFAHEPDYFRGTKIAGATDRILLARENGRLVAAGRCTTRPAWLNGEVRRVAYLGELRLDASAQGRWDILRGGYAFFAAEYARDPADFCFTSIVADNARARRLFERGARGLPRYEFIGEYLTLLRPARRRPAQLPHGIEAVTGAEVPLVELAEFLNAAAQSQNLAAHWAAEKITDLARHGLRPVDIVVLRQGARIVACAGVWDQQSFRQIQIHGYRPLLAAVRPWHNLLAPVLGTVRLPPAGGFLRQGWLTPCACAADRPELLGPLLQRAGDTAARRGLACTALGLPAGDARIPGLPGRRYPSRLYRVVWPGVSEPICALDARPCLPDIGLL
jgi:hypothetical protein